MFEEILKKSKKIKKSAVMNKSVQGKILSKLKKACMHTYSRH